MAQGIENGRIINQVVTDDPIHYLPPFDTTNPDKIKEISAALGIPSNRLSVLKTSVEEIQGDDPDKVASTKAKMAYEATQGRPVIIEDTSLQLFAPNTEDKYPPPHVKFWARSQGAKREICDEVHRKGDPRALAQTIVAVYDGKQVHKRTGITTGTIPKKPRGSYAFGWDDIFEPDHQEGRFADNEEQNRILRFAHKIKNLLNWGRQKKTFAEMTMAEKQQFSMRQKALEKMKNDPFALGTWVFALDDALQMELDAIQDETFRAPEMAMARRHAFGLRVLGNMEPNEDLEVDIRTLPPFHEVKLHPDITQYTHDPDSPDSGLILTGYELRRMLNKSSTRVLVNDDGRPTFVQHGEKSLKRALAARAYEFAIHHNPERYKELREMISGKQTLQRTNQPSAVIDQLLGKLKHQKKIVMPSDEESDDVDTISDAVDNVSDAIVSVPGFADLAYVRQFADRSLSRTKAAHNHIINRNGVPTSLLALGGMPPVTGSRDVVVTTALSFMRSYIPHNSLFVDFDRRIGLFNEAKKQIEERIPEKENEDIKSLALAQIGICVSGTNIEEISQQAQQMMDNGCMSTRIYTTNPGIEVIDSAEVICKSAFERGFTKQNKDTLPFHLCVGPIVNLEQAKKIQEISEKYGIALTLLAGHGGGENCTSLEGGAAANAIEIIYELSQMPKFNDVSLGFEGGLGSLFGPWMGIIDVISKDGSLVRGCVETQGGLSVIHKSGAPVQNYPGTASPTTQMIEQTLFPDKVNRTNSAGQLKNNEGKPNFMKAAHWAPSIIHYITSYRSLIGRVLADQQAGSIGEIMQKIKEQGYGHRISSPAAKATADAHRSV